MIIELLYHHVIIVKWSRLMLLVAWEMEMDLCISCAGIKLLAMVYVQ